jgi:hypothetical protein
MPHFIHNKETAKSGEISGGFYNNYSILRSFYNEKENCSGIFGRA